MDNIKRSVLRGALWTVAANGGDRVLGIVSMSILARLLMPGDFGLVGMGFATIAAIECLSAFGFDWALAREPNLTPQHLNTGWTLRIIVNLASAVVFAAIAAPAADYFREARLKDVVLVLALCKFLSGFENIGMVLFRRELRFEKEFQLLFYTRLANFAVVLPIAYFQKSYLALLAGLLTSRLTTLVMSYVLQPSFRPRLSLVGYRDLLFFSVWLQMNGVLAAIQTRGSDFVLGRILGTNAIATFALSREIANLAVSELAAPINRAVFSGYASIANDLNRLREGYLSVVGLMWLVCLPIAAGVACTAPQIVLLFLGAKWLAAIPVLQILAIGGVATVVTADAQYLFMTIGRPAINTLTGLVMVSLLIPAAILLSRLDGVRGAAIAYTGATFVTVPFVLWWLRRTVGVQANQLASRAWRPVMAASAMVVVVLLIRPDQPNPGFLGNLLDLAKLVCVGATVFVSAVYAAWRMSGGPRGAETQLFELARSIVSRSGKK